MQEKPFEQHVYLRDVVNAIPSPVFVLDDEARIRDANTAAIEYVGDISKVIEQHFCGVVLHCANARGSDEKCGTTEFCPDCVVRNLSTHVQANKVVRRKGKMAIIDGDKVREMHYLVTVAPFTHKESSLVLLTLEDITELVELKQIIPICAYCKKIRNDNEFWEQVEAYFQRHTGARFSHGICPDCIHKLCLPNSSEV